jgi:hypothetical protein
VVREEHRSLTYQNLQFKLAARGEAKMGLILVDGSGAY